MRISRRIAFSVLLEVFFVARVYGDAPCTDTLLRVCASEDKSGESAVFCRMIASQRVESVESLLAFYEEFSKLDTFSDLARNVLCARLGGRKEFSVIDLEFWGSRRSAGKGATWFDTHTFHTSRAGRGSMDWSFELAESQRKPIEALNSIIEELQKANFPFSSGYGHYLRKLRASFKGDVVQVERTSYGLRIEIENVEFGRLEVGPFTGSVEGVTGLAQDALLKIYKELMDAGLKN